MVIIIGLVIGRVAWFQYDELDISVLHMYKGVVIKVTVIYIEDNCFSVERWGTTHSG